MPHKRAPIDLLNQAHLVISRYGKEKEAWKKERLLTVKLLLETENTYKEVAAIVGRADSRVREWTRLYREGGVEGLLTRGNGGGCKGRTTPEIKEAIIEKLREGQFRTAKQFKKWLEEEHDLSLSVKGVYYQLGKLGGRLKVPRPSHLKKDEAKVEAFRNGLAEKLNELKIPAGKKVKLWIYDEMIYGLHPLLRKMWSLVGHRVVAPVNRRFEWGYLFGAIEVSTGKSEFFHSDGVTKEFDRAFIEQIAQSDPEAEHVIIGDGAGFHHREGVEQDDPLATNIHVLTLPPYSPELNPVEKLWDVIKDEICVICWNNIEELEEKIDEVLREFWGRAGRLRSFVKNSYLRSELNAILKIGITPFSY